VWKRRSSSAMRGIPLSIDHEYVIAYAANTESFSLKGVKKTIDGYPYEDDVGHFASTDLTVGKDRYERPNQFYPITNPRTGRVFQPNSDRVWRFVPGTMKDVVKDDLISWPDEWQGSLERPRFKTYSKPDAGKPKPVSTWIEKFEGKTIL